MENQPLDPSSFGLSLPPCQPGCQGQTVPCSMLPGAWQSELMERIWQLGSTPDSLQHQRGHCCSLKILFFFLFLISLFTIPCAFSMKTIKPKSLLPLFIIDDPPQTYPLPSQDFSVFIHSLLPLQIKVTVFSFKLGVNSLLGFSILFPFTFQELGSDNNSISFLHIWFLFLIGSILFACKHTQSTHIN